MSDNKTASESITLRSVALGTVLAFGFLMKGEGLKNWRVKKWELREAGQIGCAVIF